jgi:hypothetical protein
MKNEFKKLKDMKECSLANSLTLTPSVYLKQFLLKEQSIIYLVF